MLSQGYIVESIERRTIMNLTMKKLCDYCVQESIKNVSMSMQANNNLEKEFYRGRSLTFMWIAACIQNDSIPKEVEDE